MRFNYYEFPEDTPEEVLLSEGCGVILKSGEVIYPDTIPEEYRYKVDHIERILSGLSINHVKELMKKHGGHGWTEHCERDGNPFEVTEIRLGHKNTGYTYNHHL